MGKASSLLKSRGVTTVVGSTPAPSSTLLLQAIAYTWLIGLIIAIVVTLDAAIVHGEWAWKLP